MGQRFTWDGDKAKNNARKHKLTFEKATEAFDDQRLLWKRNGYEDGEERWEIVGSSHDGNILMFVVYTIRNKDGEEINRIISARRVTKRERKRYEYGRLRAR